MTVGADKSSGIRYTPYMRRYVAGTLVAFILSLVLGGLVDHTRAANYYPNVGTRAKDFSIVQANGVWHIVVIEAPVDSPPPGQPGSPGLEQATSADMEHWTDGGVAIPVGSGGSWDSYDTWAPSIVKSGTTYYLYYTGVRDNGYGLVQKIGLATSTDLTTWTKSSDNPVFDCVHTSWQYWSETNPPGVSADCRDPYVLRDEPNNQWVMFYNGRLDNRTDIHDSILPAYAQSLSTPAIVGIATSPDLLHWSDAGFVPATASYQAESPHVIQHDGVWYLIFTSNCAFNGTSKCIVYSTAPSLLGPYAGFADLPAVQSWHFASEAFTDEHGVEYFGRSESTLRFSTIDWSSGTFNLQSLPSATVTGAVFLDADRDGQLGPGEEGIDGVKVQAYFDNGDNIFDRASDTLLITNISAYANRDGMQQHGTYRLSSIQAGRLWLAIDPANFHPGGPLVGYTSSTGTHDASYTISDSTPVSGKFFGFTPPDVTPPSVVADLAAS